MTVVELTIASFLTMVLLLAGYSLLDSATKTERSQEARHSALLELRQTADQVTRDLRQALSVYPSSSHTVLDMETLLSGAQHRVRYDISGGQLRRTIDPTSGGVASVVLKEMQATTDPSFCYSWDPTTTQCVDSGAPPQELTSIRITLSRSPEVSPGVPLKLATDVELRNI